jgi:hypothetical protein
VVVDHEQVYEAGVCHLHQVFVFEFLRRRRELHGWLAFLREPLV